MNFPVTPPAAQATARNWAGNPSLQLHLDGIWADPDQLLAPVGLDLQGALDAVYDAAAYVDMLDYRHGTEPPLPPAEAVWAEALPALHNGK